MKKRANSIICNEIIRIVTKNNGMASVKVIDLVMSNLKNDAVVLPFLRRQRVSGDISALVCKYMSLKCINSCLYV